MPVKEGRIERGTRLASAAFSVVRGDWRLLVLPAAALFVDLVCAAGLIASAAVVGGHHHRGVAITAALCVASYPLTVSATFFNVALMHVVSQRWKGNVVGVREGLAVGRRRLGPILAWSLLAATVGLALQLVEHVGHTAWLERLFALALNFAWAVATFFVVPALALEDIGAVAAIKRSSAAVRRRWAEGLTGSVAIGGLGGLALIPGVIVCIAGVITFLSNPFAGVIVLLVGAIMVLPVMLYLSATSAVFSLAVWEYIDDGAPRGPFAAADLERPFVGGAGVAKTRQWLKTHVPRRRA